MSPHGRCGATTLAGGRVRPPLPLREAPVSPLFGRVTSDVRSLAKASPLAGGFLDAGVPGAVLLAAESRSATCGGPGGRADRRGMPPGGRTAVSTLPR